MKCSNSKCICQTLNKFVAFIALNSNLRLITFNLKFSYSDKFFIEMTDIKTVAMRCSDLKCICQINKLQLYCIEFKFEIISVSSVIFGIIELLI